MKALFIYLFAVLVILSEVERNKQSVKVYIESLAPTILAMYKLICTIKDFEEGETGGVDK